MEADDDVVEKNMYLCCRHMSFIYLNFSQNENLKSDLFSAEVCEAQDAIDIKTEPTGI